MMFFFGASSSTSSINKMIGFLGLALAVSTVNGHLFLQHPTPIEGPIKDPLDASGSNFPCHGAKVPTSGGEKMAAGSSQELIFDAGDGANTAVHGGGSCQVSITYETDPAALKKPSSWHVIHSMEGACPSGTEGNLDGQYTGPEGAYSGALQCTDPKANGVDCINSYNFTIPAGLKSGHATLAWTWFNKIGNREMYMNCISADITGGSGDDSKMADLPTMYVANLASVNSATTTEGEDPTFPNPGSSVGGADDAGSAGGAAPSYGSGASSASPPKPSAPPAGGNNNNSGPKATVTTMETLTSGYTAPTSAPAVAAPSAPSVAAPAPDSSSYGSSSSGTSCSEEGAVVCIGTTSFGLCNNGVAVPQALASGTKCSNGVISKRDHVRRHLGRSHARLFG